MTGICIDGPLMGDMISFDGVSWDVQLPPRETWCACNAEGESRLEQFIEAERVTYRPILRGAQGKVALLSIQDDEEKIISELVAWVFTDLGVGTKRLIRHCRDRRAWT